MFINNYRLSLNNYCLSVIIHKKIVECVSNKNWNSFSKGPGFKNFKFFSDEKNLKKKK